MDMTESKEIIESIARHTEKSLMEVGLSYNESIANYKNLIKRTYCNSEDLEFLERLHEFYISLDDFKKMLFVNDCLEHGTHFKYWYEQYVSRRMYRKHLNNLIASLREKFDED